MLTQFAFFLAYGVVSLPGAALVRRLGYEHSIVVALGIMIIKLLVIPVATHSRHSRWCWSRCSYSPAASPCCRWRPTRWPPRSVRPSGAHFRLTLSQAFNSLGTALAPYLMSSVVLTGGVFAVEGVASAAQRAESLRHIDLAFLAIGRR